MTDPEAPSSEQPEPDTETDPAQTDAVAGDAPEHDDADVETEISEDDLPADLDVVPDIHDLLPESDPIGVVPGTADDRVDDPGAEPAPG